MCHLALDARAAGMRRARVGACRAPPRGSAQGRQWGTMQEEHWSCTTTGWAMHGSTSLHLLIHTQADQRTKELSWHKRTSHTAQAHTDAKGHQPRGISRGASLIITNHH